MKLLDYVPCVGTRAVRPEPEKRAEPPQNPPSALERAPTLGLQKRQRWGADAWKPSLVVIPESGSFLAATEAETGGDRKEAAAKKKKAKRKSPGAGSVLSWDYRDSERQFGASSMFAAFTPSPFLF